MGQHKNRNKKRKSRNSSGATPPKDSKRQMTMETFTTNNNTKATGEEKNQRATTSTTESTPISHSNKNTMSSDVSLKSDKEGINQITMPSDLDDSAQLLSPTWKENPIFPETQNSPSLLMDTDNGSIENSDMTTILRQMNDKLSELKPMRKEIADLTHIINEVMKSIEFIQKKQTDMEKQIECLTNENQDMRTKMHRIESENSNLHNYVIKLDNYSRRENLLFSGIQEERNEDCAMKINHILSTVGGQNIAFQRCHRVGPYVHGRNRDIIARFVRYEDLEATLQRKFGLPQGIYINNDYSPDTKKKIDIMRPIQKEAKKKDNYAKLVQDTLIYKNKRYDLSNLHTLDFDTTVVGEKSDSSKVAFSGRFSPLSNLHPCLFTIDNTDYQSTEHYYQYRKCLANNDKLTAEKALNASTPEAAMLIGKQVQAKREWIESTGIKLMEKATTAKFSQNQSLMDHLKKTEKKTIVESTRNNFWGSGISFTNRDALNADKYAGKNQMGKILMDIRDKE